MESYVIYNAEYQALICRKHQYAIPPKSIERHFREEHKEISLQSRQKILRQSEVLTLCEPDEIIEPRGKVAPISIYTGNAARFPHISGLGDGYFSWERRAFQGVNMETPWRFHQSMAIAC